MNQLSGFFGGSHDLTTWVYSCIWSNFCTCWHQSISLCILFTNLDKLDQTTGLHCRSSQPSQYSSYDWLVRLVKLARLVRLIELALLPGQVILTRLDKLDVYYMFNQFKSAELYCICDILGFPAESTIHIFICLIYTEQKKNWKNNLKMILE